MYYYWYVLMMTQWHMLLQVEGIHKWEKLSWMCVGLIIDVDVEITGDEKVMRLTSWWGQKWKKIWNECWKWFWIWWRIRRTIYVENCKFWATRFNSNTKTQKKWMMEDGSNQDITNHWPRSQDCRHCWPLQGAGCGWVLVDQETESYGA